MNPQDENFELRWKTCNLCLMCGLPFASLGKAGNIAEAMLKFQTVFKEHYPKAPGLYDVPQKCHILHKKDGKVLTKIVEDPDSIPCPDREINTLEIDRILQTLKDKMKGDLQYVKDIKSRKRDVITMLQKEKLGIYKRLYNITVAGCHRCNTLMTMQKPTSQILETCKILKPDALGQKKLIYKARRIQKARSAVPAAGAPAPAPRPDEGQEDTESDDDIGDTGADDWDDERINDLAARDTTTPDLNASAAFEVLIYKSVQRLETDSFFDDVFTKADATIVMQAFFYMMTANLTCERIATNDIPVHDKFRVDGLQRLYTSFFWYVLLTVRFPKIFPSTLSFEAWHTAYAERIALSQCRSFRSLVYGDAAFVDGIAYKQGLDSDMLTALIERTVTSNLHLLRAIVNQDKIQIRREHMSVFRFTLPSVWNLGHIALTHYVRQGLIPRGDKGHDSHAKYFSTPQYCTYLIALAQHITGLNIDGWVSELGKRIMLRRFFVAAQFSLKDECRQFWQELLLDQHVAGASASGANRQKQNFVKFIIEFHQEEHYRASDAQLDDYNDVYADGDITQKLSQDFQNEITKLRYHISVPGDPHDADGQLMPVDVSEGHGHGRGRQGRGRGMRSSLQMNGCMPVTSYNEDIHVMTSQFSRFCLDPNGTRGSTITSSRFELI